jgi:hypothetical protein
MKKITLLALVSLFGLSISAQINYKDSQANYAQAGVTKDTLEVNPDNVQLSHFAFNWHFDTNKAATELEKTGSRGYLGSLQKASTRKGWRGVTFDETGRETGYATDNIGRCYNYQAGGDPVHFTNTAALIAYLDSELKYSDESGKESMNHAIDSNVCVVLDDPAGGCVFGVYPGKYKIVDIRFGFNNGTSTATSDISFDLMTLDPGNTGKTASYKLVVTIVDGTKSGQDFRNISGGATTRGVDKTDSASVYGTAGEYIDGVRRYEFANIFTTGATAFTDKVNIKIAEKCGLEYKDFSGKKILIALITEGTGEPITSGKYDPILGIDNLKFNLWVEYTPTGIPSIAIAPTKVIGKKGSLEVVDAQSVVDIYSITGQKVASLTPDVKSVAVPAGVYIASEKYKKAVKVIVK